MIFKLLIILGTSNWHRIRRASCSEKKTIHFHESKGNFWLFSWISFSTFRRRTLVVDIMSVTKTWELTRGRSTPVENALNVFKWNWDQRNIELNEKISDQIGEKKRTVSIFSSVNDSDRSLLFLSSSYSSPNAGLSCIRKKSFTCFQSDDKYWPWNSLTWRPGLLFIWGDD